MDAVAVVADVDVARAVDGDAAGFAQRPAGVFGQLAFVFACGAEDVDAVRGAAGDVDVAVGGGARFVDRDLGFLARGGDREADLGGFVTAAFAVDRV